MLSKRCFFHHPNADRDKQKAHYKAAGYTENCAESTLKARKHRQTDCPQGNIHSCTKNCELAAQNTAANIYAQGLQGKGYGSGNRQPTAKYDYSREHRRSYKFVCWSFHCYIPFLFYYHFIILYSPALVNEEGMFFRFYMFFTCYFIK